MLAILMVQALYWFALTPFFKAANPPDSVVELSRVEYARLDTPDERGWQAATFERREMPIEDCCEAGYRGVRAQFELERLPARPLGLYLRVGSDNYQLKLNGATLYGEGGLKLGSHTYHGNVRTIFRLPESVLRAGPNQLELILVRDPGSPYFNFAPPRIADYAVLSSAMKYELCWTAPRG